MTNTPNYNLSIAEGTDTVNLLTQCYPNFETIDTAMKENKDAGVGTATETKTGTNHSVIRNNTDGAVFAFTATSNYVAGDTFTVDAQAVTATTPDGQSLPSGAFVINKSVLCRLDGTVLTVFTGGGSTDAETLGGQLPSFYAKQSDMDIVENDVNTLNSNLTALDNKVDNMGRVMLWENLTPNAPFAAQTITLSDNTSNYDYLIIGYTSVNTVNGLYYESISYERRATRLFLIANAFESRNVSFSDNSATFGDNYKVSTYGQTSVTTVNTENVPLFIWGVKNK